jgi:hypothetical protein
MSGAPLSETPVEPVYQPFVCGPVIPKSIVPLDCWLGDWTSPLLLVTEVFANLSAAWMNHSTLLPESWPAPLQCGDPAACERSIVCQPVASL